MAFDLMRGFRRLSLEGPVGNGLDNDEEDVKTVKEELRREALFSQNPRIGMTGIIDHDTVDGITAFQKRQGLKPDGILTPGGETERALNRRRASRTMAANADQVEADARARGETGFSVLRANAEARAKAKQNARQERQRRATQQASDSAADRDGEDAGSPQAPHDDGLRSGQPERPAASRSGTEQPGAPSTARGGGDGKRTALAREADGHGGDSRGKATGAPGRVSTAAAREALFNLSEADRAELRELLDLPDDATTEEIEVALAAAPAPMAPGAAGAAGSGLGVGGAIQEQNKKSNEALAKSIQRFFNDAGNSLSELRDDIESLFEEDEDAGEPAAKDRPHHPAFQAIEPAPPEPPRDFDPEDVRDTPSSPPPQRPVDMSEIPPLPGFMPEDRDNLVEIFPDQSGDLPQITLVERNEHPETLQANNDLLDGTIEVGAEEGVNLKIAGGGSDRETKKDRKETFLPAENKQGREAKPGSNFIDGTIEKPGTERRILIQTVDTLRDGQTLSKREDSANWRAAKNKKTGDILVLVAKPPRGKRIDMASWKDFIRPLVFELCEPAPTSEPENKRDRWKPFDVKRRP